MFRLPALLLPWLSGSSAASCPLGGVPAEPNLCAAEQDDHAAMLQTGAAPVDRLGEAALDLLEDLGTGPVAVPSVYLPHFDTTPDYLGVAATARGVPGGGAGSVTDNYYLVVGDWGGCAGGCNACCMMQKKVAAKMQQYVARRKAARPNSQLLFILSVGDNFYWTGASQGRFKTTWKDVYGEELTAVPWFSVMGNHDYGNSDPGSLCPSGSPRFVCNASTANLPACGGAKPYSTGTQAYDGNQLDANKGGVDGALRRNYNMPDYTYYYTIPALDFELIALDWNFYDFGGMGGNGAGASALFARCGGSANAKLAMAALRDASTRILTERSQAAASGNVAIISHYPDEFQANKNLRRMYRDGLAAEKSNVTKIFNFFGHTHVQKCRAVSSAGECVDFLTGGSGGCCSTNDLPGGFVAIGFDTSKRQVVECFAPNSDCTLQSFWR